MTVDCPLCHLPMARKDSILAWYCWRCLTTYSEEILAHNPAPKLAYEAILSMIEQYQGKVQVVQQEEPWDYRKRAPSEFDLSHSSGLI